MLLLYDVLMSLALLITSPYLLPKALLGGHGLKERLGFWPRDFFADPNLGPVLWIHAASVGEVARFAIAAVRGEAPETGPVALQIPPEFAGRPLVTPELVAHAHRYGLHVHVWTIYEPDEMRRLLDLGVDGIVTDFPGRLAALIGAPTDT